ncbi:MAG: hypothetical protein IKA57_04725 [Clostridia bacterium]|nr:hypothetical protein [Clostridia bacterium]
MKRIKTLALILALATCASFSLVACDNNDDSSSSVSSSDVSEETSSIESVEDSSSISVEDSSSDNSVETSDDVSSEEISSENSSSISAENSSSDNSVETSDEISSEEVPSEDSSSISSEDSSNAEYIAPPAEDANITYKSPVSGNGLEYDRFECVEGYYEFTVKARAYTYYSFSISQPGQYALYTLAPADNIIITRYDASPQYLNEGSAQEALVLDDGKLYSLVNCGEKMFDYQEETQSSNWRATFGIKAKSGTQTVQVRFVRVAEPLYEPQTLSTTITPTEIKGVALKPEHSMPTPVPYDSDYFYDADYEMTFNTPIGANATGTVTAKGFYRLCTRDDQGNILTKGDVIYAGIETGSRLMDVSFAEAQNSGNALTVFIKKDETTGDYIVYDYISFITNNDGGSSERDTTKACYMNVCNADGLFPVNQELFNFLNNYVKVHNPILGDDEVVADENLWLSACSYYQPAEEGSDINPVEIPVDAFSETVNSFTYTVNVNKAYTDIYHSIKWHGLDNKASGYYTITSNDDNAWLTIDKKNYSGKFSVTFEVDKATGKTFTFSCANGGIGTFDVTISEAQGVYKTPYTLTSLENVTLSTNEILDVTGEKIYFAVYTYAAVGEDSVLSISSETAGVEFTIVAGADEHNVVSKDNDGNVSFTVLVFSTSAIDSIPTTITLTPVEPTV